VTGSEDEKPRPSTPVGARAESAQAGGRVHVKSGAIVAGTSVSVQVAASTGLWATWAGIAAGHEDAAHRARADVVRIYAEGGDWGEPSTAELEASLVAISGAAFAIDGFYGSVKPWSSVSPQLIQLWKQQRIARNRQILELFKHDFVLGSATNRWPKQLKWLFKLRDDNVHFDEDFRPPAPHPVIGNTTHERMTYVAENAEKAIDVMLDVLTRLVDHPKPSADQLLIDFAQRWQPNLRALARRRDELKQARGQSAVGGAGRAVVRPAPGG
jgi:hypothetical protein